MSEFSFLREKAANDDGFRNLLLSDSASACREVGVSLPIGMTLKILEDSASRRHIVLNDIDSFMHIPEVAKVIDRAANDPHFKAQLISSPAEAIFEELGLAVPSSVELVVLENSPTVMNIVLESVELDDLTLAHVAGGKGTIGSPAASSGGKGAPSPKPSAPKPEITPPLQISIPTFASTNSSPPTPSQSAAIISALSKSSSTTSGNENALVPPGKLNIP